MAPGFDFDAALRRHIQFDGKAAAAFRQVFGADAAAAQLQNLLDQGQAQAVALLFMGAVALIKLFENMRKGSSMRS